MIKSLFSNNKVTANQLAKQIIIDQLSWASHQLEDKSELTEIEKGEIIRHLNKHADAINKKFDARKLYKL